MYIEISLINLFLFIFFWGNQSIFFSCNMEVSLCRLVGWTEWITLLIIPGKTNIRLIFSFMLLYQQTYLLLPCALP